jgi:LDH2 family malate/lactate/ureidoglycolate dehydrogenase
VQPEDARARLLALGFSDEDAETLLRHFEDAERRGKAGHGFLRIEWLATLPDLNPNARPTLVRSEPGFEHWDGNGALGYLTLAAVCRRLAEEPPERSRLVVASRCFPSGALGYWVRGLAERGLLALLTATSPARLAPPAGGPPLAGTNPVAIGVPSSDGRPAVVDVAMGKVTYGDVLEGRAAPDELVPFGGEQAHKAFALALGLQLFVDSLTGGEDFGAVLLVARPDADPLPGLRARAGAVRLPGDR